MVTRTSPPNEDDSDNHGVNQLEYSVPVYSEGYATRGCSLVRAVKVPAGAGSLSHDSCCGSEPHNYFSLGFVGVREHV